MTPLQEFLQNFHTLEGKLPGQRQASFRKNLDTFKKSKPNQETIQQAVLSLVPRTILEEALKIDFLIEFRLTPQLLEILKGENIHLIKKVIKEKWLWQEGFETITPKQFIEDLLPNVSYVTRKTILNRLAALFQNESLADEYYEKSVEKYGSYETNCLLPCCSQAKILYCVEKFKLTLLEKHVLALVKKDYTFFELYLKAQKTHKKQIDDYTAVWRYLATYHTETYFRLRTQYNSFSRLNRKSTKVLMYTYKKEILEDLRDYNKVLDMPYVFVKYYKTDSEIMIKHFFPKKSTEFWLSLSPDIKQGIPSRRQWFRQNNVTNYLAVFPKNQRYEILSKTHQKLYNKDYLMPHRVNNDIMHILPKEEIEKWVEIKYAEDKNDSWYQYLPLEKSIPLFKKKVSVTSDIYKRKDLLKYLVSTCGFNGKNTESLLEVLQYFIGRHKNDDALVRSTFLETINQSFKLEQLSKEHWGIIVNLMKIMELNNENHWILATLREKYIHYLMLNGESIKEELVKLLKTRIGTYNNTFKPFVTTPKEEKILLLTYESCLEEVYEDKEQLKNSQLQFFILMCDWNSRYPEDRFDLLGPNLKYLELMMESWMESPNQNFSVFNKILQEDWKNAEKLDLYPVIWKFLESGSYLQEKFFRKLLFVEIDRILDKADILTSVRESYNLDWFWILCSKFEHLGLPQKITGHSKNVLAKDLVKVSKYDVKVLALLLPYQEFFNVIEDKLPTDGEVPVDFDKDLLKLQENIVKSFRYTRNLSEASQVLLKFTIGDYLKYSLGTAYFLALNLPEFKVQKIFDVLWNKAVSVRKHVVSMKNKMGTLPDNISFLQRFGAKERNATVCKFILKSSMTLFLRNPSERTWQLVVSNSMIMDAEDEEAFDLFLNYGEVPTSYRSNFVKLAWTVFDKAESSIKPKKYNLITSLSRDVIKSLDQTFCLEIIKEKLFDQCDVDKSFLEFARKYVTCDLGDKNLVEAKLDQILLLSKAKIDQHWNTLGSKIRKAFAMIIDGFCKEAVKMESKLITTLLLAKLDKLVSLEEIYVDVLTLQMIDLYFDHCTQKMETDGVGDDGSQTKKVLNWKDFAVGVTKWFKSTCGENLGLVDIFCATVSNVLSILDGNVKDEINFIEGLCLEGDSPINALLILHFIPLYLNDAEEYKSWEKFLGVVERNTDSVVRIRYKNFLRDLEINL